MHGNAAYMPAMRQLRSRLAVAAVAASLNFQFLSSPAAAQAEPADIAAAQETWLSAQAEAAIVDQGRGLGQLHGLVVARNGEVAIAERFRGAALDQTVNIKSASKTIIASLVGRAIDEGLIESIDQPIAELIPDKLPADADPRLATVTVGNLLSMQSGLERTSGGNYGRWVASNDWVRFALSRPFVDVPGGGMLYSTGNTHVLSAILTEVSGRSTRELFSDWIAEPLGIRVGAWDRDPQGIYLGGNQMALSPHGLLAFGEMIRNGGTLDGEQILPADWIAGSWQPRTRSIHSGEQYGLGWFIATMRGHPVYYAWGFGGQMLYVVPDLALTVVMTSAVDVPSGRTGYVDELHGLMSDAIIPAAEAASG